MWMNSLGVDLFEAFMGPARPRLSTEAAVQLLKNIRAHERKRERQARYRGRHHLAIKERNRLYRHRNRDVLRQRSRRQNEIRRTDPVYLIQKRAARIAARKKAPSHHQHLQRERDRRRSRNITPSYAKRLLKARSKLKSENFPQEVVELKQAHIKLCRAIKSHV